MDATKEIKRIMLETDTSLTELADRLETSTNNINNKMRRNNWRTSELKEIFGCMGYDVELKVTKSVDEFETYKYIEQFINLTGKKIDFTSEIYKTLQERYRGAIATQKIVDKYYTDED